MMVMNLSFQVTMFQPEPKVCWGGIDNATSGMNEVLEGIGK